ncbi:MAG TPA: urate oxidase [Phycisphaerae bacterium]|nr:urate oxidase [Phycisphaerae bacterium]
MAKLAHNAYGKSDVRVTKVVRHGDGGGRHDLLELSVNIQLEGAFEKSYLSGDNSQIVATDTMKNTVYALAKKLTIESIEGFARDLGRHFVERNSHVTSAVVAIEEHRWNRIGAVAFEGSSREVRTTVVKTSRKCVEVTSGLDGLLVLKTTDSGFVGFLRDEYTTLPEVTDRIFATVVKAEWRYTQMPADANAAHAKARGAMLEVFAGHKSLAVQQTLFAMGEAVLKVVPEVEAVTITMPNKHRIPANLKALGLEFEGDVFVTTEEPFGEISGTVER